MLEFVSKLLKAEPPNLAISNIFWITLTSVTWVASLLFFYRFSVRTVLASATSIAVIMTFRISDWQMRLSGVRNEDRSLYCYGHEIHHLAWGLVGMGLLALANQWSRTSTIHLAFQIALGLSVGTFIDQITYFTLTDLSDVAYISIPSLMAPILWITYWIFNGVACAFHKADQSPK